MSSVSPERIEELKDEIKANFFKLAKGYSRKEVVVAICEEIAIAQFMESMTTIVKKKAWYQLYIICLTEMLDTLPRQVKGVLT